MADQRGGFLGSALYSSSSQIALRKICEQRLAPAQLPELLSQRLKAAMAYRQRFVEDSDSYRLVFSEADEIPGLIVDKYNDLLVLQVLTQAMDRDDLRKVIQQTLIDELRPAAIIERVEPRIRELEGLPSKEGGLTYGSKLQTISHMNGIQFRFRGDTGQKTGGFLDQRENYAAAAKFARGRALDIFCYQGGFSLHLARVCDLVTGVDISREALQTAEQNEALNKQLLQHQIEWIAADAFELMRDYAAAGQQYDTIVLDPPAFAKTKRAVPGALKGYKELNLRALKMLRPGGLLVTCSCSFHVSEAEFLGMLSSAAQDAHRRLNLLERRAQSPDHPVVVSIPETHYLKFVSAIAV